MSDINWEPQYTEPKLPSIEELHAQERARRKEWQAKRYEQLKEMLR